MAENRDIAFCFRGWAYDTGKVDRPKKRVIRISRVHTSKGAKAILTINDTTDAGIIISPKEEDIEGVDYGLLAVIIGELLPAEVPDYKLFTNSLPLHEFDPGLHSLTIRHNINAFCSEFRGETLKDSQQTAPSSPLTGQDDHGQISSFISTAISAYRTFPCKKYLQQLIDRFRALERTPLEGLSTPDEASMEVIRDMMEGKGVTGDINAGSVVRAFKELWPYQFEAVGEDRINIRTIFELAKGLGGISASGIVIHESLYRGVMVSFCTMFSNSHAVDGGMVEYHDNLIRSAIRIAQGSASAPMPERPLAHTVDGNPGVALLEALIRDSEAHVEHFKAWAEATGQACIHGSGPGQLYKLVQLTNVVLGTQNQEAIATALGEVKQLVITSAFGAVSRILTPVDSNVELYREVLQAAVHAVAADVVEKFVAQAEQETDAMEVQPTLPGLPADLVKLADKVSDLYHALGSAKEEDARKAASEAVREYKEKKFGEEVPGSVSTPGFPSSLSRRDIALLRYMRQVFEKECDAPGGQDLDKELAWASRID
ncbi:hypothetical protein N0V84_006589 [Fusarium piperis]|uniref:Uncharacterized protein n=1 Tax=Fusarium piperis TaxID=1435070 RepID=A0A9W8WBQ9_9HYPO|nr:hypothetical protein N0V84_006589 [Fusarium piperis]